MLILVTLFSSFFGFFVNLISSFFVNLTQVPIPTPNAMIVSWYDFLLGVISTLIVVLVLNFLSKTWDSYNKTWDSYNNAAGIATPRPFPEQSKKQKDK